ASRSTGDETRPDFSRARKPCAPDTRPGGTPAMPIDPLDQQLVQAVLTRPRRGKADLEEAKLAGLRPSRAALDEVDDEEEEEDVDEEPDLALGEDLDDDAAVEVVGEDAEARTSRLPAEGPTKLDADELEEPTA